MSARKLTATVVVLTVIWSGALALTGAPAFGAVAHKLLPLSFGEFTKATDVTVDQANGNVYVTDSGANQVDVFGAEGGSPVGGIKTPLTGTGMEPSPMFDFHGEPSAVAIDESGGTSNGDLYVSDTDHNVVEKFKLGALGGYEYVCEFTGYGKGCWKNLPKNPRGRNQRAWLWIPAGMCMSRALVRERAQWTCSTPKATMSRRLRVAR